MRLRNLFLFSAMCGVGLWAQTPQRVPADPHESPVSAVNSDENSQLPPSSKPGSKGSKQPGKTSSSKNIGTNSQDRAFLAAAAKDGQEEVQRAQMMLVHSENSEVKALAQKLMAEYTPVNQELEAWAKQKDVDLPANAPGNVRQMSDKAYLTSEVARHRKAIQLFEKESSGGLDRDLRGFAANMLPSLQRHLKMARSVEGGGSPTTGNSDDARPGSSTNSSGLTTATSSTPATSATTTTSTYTPKVAHPADSVDGKSGNQPTR